MTKPKSHHPSSSTGSKPITQKGGLYGAPELFTRLSDNPSLRPPR